MVFQQTIELLRQLGFFSYFFPFVLMFAIFYALLTKSKIFGDPKEKSVKRINTVISFIASFFVLALTPLVDLAAFLSAFFGTLFMILVALLSFLIIAFMVIPSEDWEKNKGKYLKILAPICAIIVIAILLTSSGYSFFPTLQPTSMPKVEISTQDLLIILLVFGLIFIIWFVTREEKKEETKGKEIVSFELRPVTKKE
ncbi:MAG: hypothetical protein QXP77_01210 [Candidatus Aenigmatarchaeota archaeon]